MQVPAAFQRLARHRARPTTALLAAGLAALAAAGLATAQSGGEEVIHACVSKTGEVRIINPNDACPKNTTALDWNRQGPPGPQGEPGEPATSLFATVDSQGAPAPNVLDASRTTPGVTLEQLDRGVYNVVFPRPLVGCAAVASLQNGSRGGDIEAALRKNPDNTVQVRTGFDFGSGLPDATDLPFTVAIFC